MGRWFTESSYCITKHHTAFVYESFLQQMGRWYAPSSFGLFVLHNTIKKQFERQQLADVQTAFMDYNCFTWNSCKIVYCILEKSITFTSASCWWRCSGPQIRQRSVFRRGVCRRYGRRLRPIAAMACLNLMFSARCLRFCAVAQRLLWPSGERGLRRRLAAVFPSRA